MNEIYAHEIEIEPEFYCEHCGQKLHKYDTGMEAPLKWAATYHGLEDCIRNLNEDINQLSNEASMADEYMWRLNMRIIFLEKHLGMKWEEDEDE